MNGHVRPRRREVPGRPELAVVFGADGQAPIAGITEEIGERVGQAQRSRELRAVPARAEQPDLGHGYRRSRLRRDPGEPVLLGQPIVEEGQQVRDLLRNGVDSRDGTWVRQGGCRLSVATRRAADTEVDPVAEERREDTEGLGARDRRVVGEHDALAANPDRRGRDGDQAG